MNIFPRFRSPLALSQRYALTKTYRRISSVPIDILWQQLVNMADISWHPLFAKTNAPMGLIAKPGLFLKAVTRLTPIPVRLFVENVRPGNLLSLRILAIPGLEQKITYQIESTLYGTYITYSVILRGWLSPVIWWMIKPYSDRVVNALANAAKKVA